MNNLTAFIIHEPSAQARHVKQKLLGGLVIWNFSSFNKKKTCMFDLGPSLVRTVSATLRCTADVRCEKPGPLADPNDCRSFYMCSKKRSGFIAKTRFTCPPRMVFSHVRRFCVHRARVIDLRSICLCNEFGSKQRNEGQYLA